MTYGALCSIADTWLTAGLTPDGVGGLLATSRSLWRLAWYDYDLLVVSGSWSLIAVEAALRHRLEAGRNQPMQDLARRAVAQGFISAEWRDRLDAGRQLRNRLLHASSRTTWTVGLAAPVIEASHRVVADLYRPKR